MIASPGMAAPDIEVFPPQPRDIPRIHEAYEELGESGRAFFHPGFLGRERWTLLGAGGRCLLRASARPVLQRLLVSAPLAPYLIARVARSGDTICGFSFVVVRKSPGWKRGSFGIFVCPRLQGKGVGRQLTLAVLDAAAEDGLPEVELTVQVRNERARRLYEECGFVVAEVQPRSDVYNGTAYDSLRMTVRLPRTGVTP